MTMGVYCIQIEKEDYWCSYVGISKNIKARWSKHRSTLNNNNHDNEYLQRAWNKYGIEYFEFHILQTTQDYKELYNLEKEYCYSFGYNDRDLCFNIGTPGEVSPTFGKSPSQETKEKISNSLKGRYKKEENPFYGKKHTPEAIRVMNEKNHNRKLTSEQVSFIFTVANNSEFTYDQLCSFFNIGKSTISHIKHRKRWKHVEIMPTEEYEEYKRKLLNK